MNQHLMNDDTERAPVWLITYSDLMTLLLVMFVLLFSLSEFKQTEKFQGVARSIHAKFGHTDEKEAVASTQAVLSGNLRAGFERRAALLLPSP
ncbi:flagellar motor protein MotB [Anatilimnocola floriformis]|uniref:flagellar motor protein MotB n=1 Tax=Anatilimnocola floriformis TaxID=2948575 RepID=UPI0020C30C97|nr:flagellar motor protein MotB [Anatilimnocola floriformis]